MLAKSGRRSPSKSAMANVKPGPREAAGRFSADARAAVPPQTRTKNRNEIKNRNDWCGLLASRCLTVVAAPSSLATLSPTLVIDLLALTIPFANPLGEREFSPASSGEQAALPRRRIVRWRFASITSSNAVSYRRRCTRKAPSANGLRPTQAPLGVGF